MASKDQPRTTHYAAISIHDDDKNDGGSDDDEERPPCCRLTVWSYLTAVVIFLLVVSGLLYNKYGTRSSVLPFPSTHQTTDSMDNYDDSYTNPPLPMPFGVNLASWLSLEDYFFVGDDGAVEVATPNNHVAAVCLPPLHTTSNTGPSWQSETDLFHNLTQQYSVAHAIRVFAAFRTTYMDLHEDLRQIAAQGIRNVRVPVSWCLTDHDPFKDELLLVTTEQSRSNKDDDALLLQRYTCKDPFFEQQGIDVYWPAVPKPLLQQLLRACHTHGIQATLDIHTYMGGTSLGTFSGVWPRPPLFWYHDDPESTQDVGRQVFKDWLTWMESLSESDPGAFAGIGGITPMNEPAHLAGLFGPGSNNPQDEGFVPLLPRHLAKSFMADMEQKRVSNVSVPDGSHLRVLLWQTDAVAAFRETTLPGKGVNIVVNVHESIFVPALVQDDATNSGATHPQATAIFASWWESITSAEERRSWAVLDMHHYHAWESACSGTVDGSGSYQCGDDVATDNVLETCTSWAQVYRSSFINNDDEDASFKLYSGEFSASTFHTVAHSCLDVTTLRKSYVAQVEAARAANVKLFWWSWKMPFGGAFRPAWSFKHLMYLLGHEGFAHPDESVLSCR